MLTGQEVGQTFYAVEGGHIHGNQVRQGAQGMCELALRIKSKAEGAQVGKEGRSKAEACLREQSASPDSASIPAAIGATFSRACLICSNIDNTAKPTNIAAIIDSIVSPFVRFN